MDEIFLSIQEGNTKEIQQIKYPGNCPKCRMKGTCKGHSFDADNIVNITCSNPKCNTTFRIPRDDWNHVTRMVQNDPN